MIESPLFPRLALLGVGYMGGSLALAARQRGLTRRVVGFDRSPQSADLALTSGIVDELAVSARAAVAEADLVVLAGPVAALSLLAESIADATPPGAVVIDIGSVKGPVVAAVERTALRGRFVGCHPLAGTEASGPGAAEAGLYVGKPCFVCVGPGARPDVVVRVEAFWERMGSPLLTMDAAEHDALMAAASHLPHVAAFALAASLRPVLGRLEAGIPAAAPPTSLRDTTRVAASNPAVWRDIFLANRDELLPLVRGLEARLADLRSCIERGDGEALERFLSEGQACRARVVP